MFRQFMGFNHPWFYHKKAFYLCSNLLLSKKRNTLWFVIYFRQILVWTIVMQQRLLCNLHNTTFFNDIIIHNSNDSRLRYNNVKMYGAIITRAINYCEYE